MIYDVFPLLSPELMCKVNKNIDVKKEFVTNLYYVKKLYTSKSFIKS